MDQVLFNIGMSIGLPVIGWFVRLIWEGMKEQDLKNDAIGARITQIHEGLGARLNQIEVLVAGHYVRRDELAGTLNRIDHKLDAISIKLDGKADK